MSRQDEKRCAKEEKAPGPGEARKVVRIFAKIRSQWRQSAFQPMASGHHPNFYFFINKKTDQRHASRAVLCVLSTQPRPVMTAHLSSHPSLEAGSEVMFLLLIHTLTGLVGCLVAARLRVPGSSQLPPSGGIMS